MKTAIIIWVVVILVAIIGPQTLYTVDETQLVVVTRFGEIQDTHTTPGLKVKVPFIESVNTFDKRILRIDTPPARLNDREKQILVIDAYTRYRITDVERFFTEMRTLERAENRVGTIVSNKLKEEVAGRLRLEIIGSQLEVNATGDTVVIGTTTRQEILTEVLINSNHEVGTDGEDFGLEILDVRIKRADFSQDIQETIFNRMRAERERISRETRALGAEEDLKIRAAVDRERTIILAEADKTSNLLKGEGEAEAVRIFAEALEQDPEFFAFQRSLEAYKKFLSTNTTVVLSSDAELFRFLQDPEGNPASNK